MCDVCCEKRALERERGRERKDRDGQIERNRERGRQVA